MTYLLFNILFDVTTLEDGKAVWVNISNFL
jgi:hypothetical protein